MRLAKYLTGATVVLMASACFNIDSYLTIKGPDDVDYRVVISTPSETAFLIKAIEDSLGKFDRTETTVRNDTTYLTAEVSGIPIDSLTEFGFMVEKLDGNTYRIWQENSTEDTTGQNDEILTGILKDYRMTLTVVVENGKVLEHNANEVKGNTYFWKTTLDRVNSFSPSITIRFQKTGSGNLLLITGILVLAIGAGIILFMKSRK